MSQYDVTPSGDFIMSIAASEGTGLQVVVNWHEELKRLVPTED